MEEKKNKRNEKKSGQRKKKHVNIGEINAGRKIIVIIIISVFDESAKCDDCVRCHSTIMRCECVGQPMLCVANIAAAVFFLFCFSSLTRLVSMKTLQSISNESQRLNIDLTIRIGRHQASPHNSLSYHLIVYSMINASKRYLNTFDRMSGGACARAQTHVHTLTYDADEIIT